MFANIISSPELVNNIGKKNFDMCSITPFLNSLVCNGSYLIKYTEHIYNVNLHVTTLHWLYKYN